MQQNSSCSRRSRSSSAQPDTSNDDTRNVSARDVDLDLPPKMPAFLQQSQGEISARFHELTWIERGRVLQGVLDPSPDHQWAISNGPWNELLDRYRNIRPWTNNRIRLSVPEGHNDYINASPISLKSEQTGRESKYIAMQGPKEGSINHVWRMVWDELASPAVIVMLTETHEAGHEKCYPYFPSSPNAPAMVINEQDEFGDGFKATVRCAEVVNDLLPNGESTEVRKLIVQVEGQEEKIVWHILYIKWPDFGVLAHEDLEGLFAVIELSNRLNSSRENPRIIHCSAGIGRSGTFIALEYLMDELKSGALESGGDQDANNHDPVFETVNKLREQRRSMVQADAQYSFIYNVLRQLWERKHSIGSEQNGKIILDDPANKIVKVEEMEDASGQK